MIKYPSKKEEEKKMNKPIVGLQLYTLREYCKSPKDTARTLEKVSRIGYRVVQLSGIGPIDTRELKNILDSNGLYACSTHTAYKKLLGELDEVIEEHQILGAEAIICPGLPSKLHNREGYLKATEELKKVIEKVKKNGFTLGYHNHAIELERYREKTGLEILLDGCPSLEGEIDTYWIQHGGGDPVAWIRKMKGRMPLVHLKDMAMRGSQQLFAEVGEGNLNWPAILDACKESGAEWYIVEQDTCQRDPFESLAISFRNLKAMGID